MSCFLRSRCLRSPFLVRMPRKRFNSVLRVPKSTRSSIDQGPSVLSSDGASESRKRPGKVIGYWLLGTAGLVYGIVVLGGLTRLTESGLSITEWKPVTGSIPPMTEAAWNSEFDLYKSSPEFKILNADLNLEEFKFIYNMEWSHRQLGRTIGLVFAVPALAIILRRRYPARFRAKLGAISCLIGFQGFIGWWMVRSGLKEDLTNPRVSQYRLATHLGTAFLVYLSMLHTSLTILTPSNGNLTQSSVINQRQLLALPSFRRSLLALGGLTFLTAISGAFVAGLDAGLIYNDFPYMGNSYIPPTGELLIGLPTLNDTSSLLATIVHNMFENPVLAQLDHRILAMTTATSTLALAGWTTVKCQQGVLPKVALRGIAGVTALVLMQATLGICTLWYLVPTPLAATHQAGSLAVLTGIVLCLARTRTGHTSRFIASVGLRA